MFGLGQYTKVYIASEPLDFRKQIDGLSLYVQETLSLDPLSAHVFVFRNRARDKLKLLYWDSNGFCLLYKRLERGRFHWPSTEGLVVECQLREVQWLLEGFNIDTLQARKIINYKRI